jgi:hypothetical protein
MAVFPVSNVDVADVAQVLKEAYRINNPAVIVKALPVLRCVVVRADVKTTRDIRKLITRLDESAVQPVRYEVMTIPPGTTDPRVVEEVIRALNKADNKGNAGRSRAPGFCPVNVYGPLGLKKSGECLGGKR